MASHWGQAPHLGETAGVAHSHGPAALSLSSTSSTETADRRQMNTMKILLVEDNPIDQLFVVQSLREVEDFSFDLVHVTTLAAALASASSTPYDVVLLDLWLPDSEGMETCLEVMRAHLNCPVVVMTSSDDHALATEAIRNGAQDYLVKGDFPGSAIARVLQYAVDRYRFHRELAIRESQFEQVLSGVPAIIWTTDQSLEITSLVGAGVRVLELDPTAVVGRSVREYAEDQDGVLHAHENALAGRGTALETHWRGRTMELRISTLRDHESKIRGTIGVALDVTEQRTLRREISFARAVQESLLPHEQPQLEGFDIYGASYPARQTCGDWYDFLDFSDGSLGIVVGDVSGKGFGPAILSASMTAFLEVLSETHQDLAETLTLCNHLACKRQTERFAVLSLGQIRDAELTLSYCGAGEDEIQSNPTVCRWASRMNSVTQPQAIASCGRAM